MCPVVVVVENGVGVAEPCLVWPLTKPDTFCDWTINTALMEVPSLGSMEISWDPELELVPIVNLVMSGLKIFSRLSKTHREVGNECRKDPMNRVMRVLRGAVFCSIQTRATLT